MTAYLKFPGICDIIKPTKNKEILFMKKITKALTLITALALLFALAAVTVCADAPDVSALFAGRTFTAKTEEGNVTLDFTDGSYVFSDGVHTVTVPADSLAYSEDDSSDGCIAFVGENDYDSLRFFSENGIMIAVQAFGEMLCDYENWEYDFSLTYTDPTIEPDGSFFYPWEYEGLSVYEEYSYANSVRFDSMTGESVIPAREDGDSFPWDDMLTNTEIIMIGSGITSIGRNAFTPVKSDSVTLEIYGEDLTTIGDSAFDGVNIDTTLMLPEAIEKIGSRAFTSGKIEVIDFGGKPAEIADDAFAGVSAEVYVPVVKWNESDKAQFGGTLTYINKYKIHVENICGDESWGWSEWEAPAGIEQTIEIEENYGGGWLFDRAELTEGTIPDFSEDKLLYTFVPTDSVTVSAYYRYDEEAAAEYEEETVISDEELLNDILESEEVSGFLKTVKTALIIVSAIIGAGIAAAIFFIVRAIVKKKKK